jgi:hypothetical protein
VGKIVVVAVQGAPPTLAIILGPQSSRITCHCSKPVFGLIRVSYSTTETLKTNMDTLGPLRYPFLRHRPDRALQTWPRTYGLLFFVWMGIQLYDVISGACIARDSLVSNGAIFSSRKEFYINCQPILLGRGITMTLYTIVVNDKLQGSDVRG